MARKVAIVETVPVADEVSNGLAAGDHVWFADRSNGRLTEHLATVDKVIGPTSLRLKVIDQGELRVFDAIGPWGNDSIQGWWRV